MSETEITVKQFVEEALQTENQMGKKFLENYIAALDKSWEPWSRCPFTPETLTSLIYGICARVTLEIRKLADFDGQLEAARDFLKEVCTKAKKYGPEPEPDSLDAIIVPKRWHEGQA